MIAQIKYFCSRDSKFSMTDVQLINLNSIFNCVGSLQGEFYMYSSWAIGVN